MALTREQMTDPAYMRARAAAGTQLYEQMQGQLNGYLALEPSQIQNLPRGAKTIISGGGQTLIQGTEVVRLYEAGTPILPPWIYDQELDLGGKFYDNDPTIGSHPTKPALPPRSIIPTRAVDAKQEAAVPSVGVSRNLVPAASSGNLISTAITGIGSVISGGGLVSTVAGILGGTGKSKCPGPYNYVNGQCVPKAGFTGTTTGGGSTSYPTQTVPLPPTPGITTPGEYSTGGWDVQVDQMGNAVAAPMIASRVVRKCPPGWKLSKAGMCYEKIPNRARKYPKPAKGPISARDWKALQAIDRVQRTVRKVAGTAGFTCKKR